MTFMEIRIRRIGRHTNGQDPSDVTNTYCVTDNGRDFTITCRSHRHGTNLGMAGQDGFLYTDADTGTVRRQVVAVGMTCGIIIESDEVVEGLSPFAIRGVIMADRSGEAGEITVTAGGLERGSP
ncbi:MAG: hypothetical protein ABSC19_00225 [Syntrophorhabdales bacterium]|jgi:hypothetical protein